MSSREFAEWMAFAQVEPFGEVRADQRTALLAATTANGLTPRKDGRPWRMADFMLTPQDEESEAEARTGRMLGFVQLLTRRLGGRDLRPDA